ncbi:thiol peroxidase [Desulfobaculum xiamenense]|uniref:Thiol peroxidase n=1 Tax=Desulfobaculum xiamenense TaxID=995050 RepID=A0A846QS78_9BACT|nr:thiol peroxidase [Desulfobaculum xiamenense]NJB68034.1 thiol peroxidase [Desulfobaculum xiamenense]
MADRTGIITLHGNGLTLAGTPVQVGQKAPNFTVLDTALAPKTLADYAGRVLIISSVPSLDTPVCDMETRRFNTEAANLGDVTILTISTDLPFAQKRWCGAAGVDKVVTLSDHRDLSFGMAYGLVIRELRLLARAVLVVDPKGVIAYQQIVGEVSQEPDYAAALTAARAAL